MRTTTIIIFFSVFFTITGLISFYVFIRGLQSIPSNSSLRNAYILAFWFLALSFMGGRIFEKLLPSLLTDFLIWTGSLWIGALIYFLLAVVFLDALRLANHFLPFFPSVITDNYAQAKYITAAGVLGLVGLLMLGGHINSVIPRTKKLNLSIAGKSSLLKTLNVVVVSDIHLGTIVGRARIDNIVNRINALNPDIVLMPGDIVDEDLGPVIKQNLGDALKSIHSRFGTYAATGNHEYIGGVEKACSYLAAHNVTMVRDQSIKIGDSFFLVGREDRGIAREGRRRKGLNELMAAVDAHFPVILMDHQPFGLNEAAQEGVDLQLSGHTHNGQLWPLNYIVESIYTLPWGYARIGDTHYYVSNGVGTWGPPVRIGNRPEIVQILLHFQ